MHKTLKAAGQKVGRFLSVLLIVTGVILLLIPGGQWAFAIYAQHRLEQKFLSTSGHWTTDRVPVASEPADIEIEDGLTGIDNWLQRTMAFLIENPALILPADEELQSGEKRFANSQYTGDFAGALIRIPAINVRAVVLYGTSRSVLAQGPGLYEISSLPDQPGNVAIAGHRTTYGAWFRHVDRLQPGDYIELDYRGSTYVYQVERVWVIQPNDWSVVAQVEDSVLTLTTCHPPGSAAQRLAVRARLVETVP